MLTKKVFVEQITRIEALFDHHLPVGGHQIWKDELTRSGINDEGLTAGTDYLLSKPQKYFPNVTSLIQDCKFVMGQVKAEAEREKRHSEEAKAEKDWAEKDSKPNSIARDCVALFKKMWAGELKPKEFYDGVKALEKKYPGVGFKGSAEVYMRESLKRGGQPKPAVSSTASLSEQLVMDAKEVFK